MTKQELQDIYTDSLSQYKCVGSPPPKSASKLEWEDYIQESRRMIDRAIDYCLTLNTSTIRAIAQALGWTPLIESRYHQLAYKITDGKHISISCENASFVIENSERNAVLAGQLTYVFPLYARSSVHFVDPYHILPAEFEQKQ